MRMFQNDAYVVLRDSGFTAVAMVSRWGAKGEFVISVYRDGHKAEADRLMTQGGRLSRDARCGSTRLLAALISASLEKWRGVYEYIFCEAPDDRRIRIYKKILDRMGITHEVDDHYIKIII